VWAARTRLALARVGVPIDDAPPEPSFEVGQYDHRHNVIWLSPEIVRPPFVYADELNAMTFGALGEVLGHEIAHALSPWSRAYDARGRLRETWSKGALGAYDERVACLARQSGLQPAADLARIDENVADLTGLALALDALEREVSRVGSTRPPNAWRIELFVAFAQSACTLEGDWRSDLLMASDPHALVRDRINGAVKNVPKFAETFLCTPGMPLAPRERCAIW